ncbi:MAG: hypothetical protein WCL11_11180 [Verrucomicrobiota bacterium]
MACSNANPATSRWPRNGPGTNATNASGKHFAAALAKQLKAELVTGDMEFKAMEKEIKIAWLK